MVCQTNHTQIVPVYVLMEYSLEQFFDPVQYAGALLQNANYSFPQDIKFELERVDSIQDFTLYEIQNVAMPRTITIMMTNAMQKNLHFKGFAWRGTQENDYAGLIMMYLNPQDSFEAHLQTLIHELGHLYRLDHSLDIQGVMYPIQNSNESIYFTDQELDIILHNKRLYGTPKENCVCCRKESEYQLFHDYFPHIMKFVLRYQNAPYQFLGTGNPSFDCSGLWAVAFDYVGIHLPRMVEEQFWAVQHISEEQLQPGDLIFFTTTDGEDYISHVGMYVGDNYMYNSNKKYGIGFTELTAYWQDRIIKYGRVVSDAIVMRDWNSNADISL